MLTVREEFGHSTLTHLLLLCCYIYSNQVSSPHHLQLVLQLVQTSTMLWVSASHTHTHTSTHSPTPLTSSLSLRHVELLSYRLRIQAQLAGKPSLPTVAATHYEQCPFPSTSPAHWVTLGSTPLPHLSWSSGLC